jgi:hypothetical protein
MLILFFFVITFYDLSNVIWPNGLLSSVLDMWQLLNSYPCDLSPYKNRKKLLYTTCARVQASAYQPAPRNVPGQQRPHFRIFRYYATLPPICASVRKLRTPTSVPLTRLYCGSKLWQRDRELWCEITMRILLLCVYRPLLYFVHLYDSDHFRSYCDTNIAELYFHLENYRLKEGL